MHALADDRRRVMLVRHRERTAAGQSSSHTPCTARAVPAGPTRHAPRCGPAALRACNTPNAPTPPCRNTPDTPQLQARPTRRPHPAAYALECRPWTGSLSAAGMRSGVVLTHTTHRSAFLLSRMTCDAHALSRCVKAHIMPVRGPACNKRLRIPQNYGGMDSMESLEGGEQRPAADGVPPQRPAFGTDTIMMPDG
jgi:hypothetical protein